MNNKDEEELDYEDLPELMNGLKDSLKDLVKILKEED